MTAIRVQAVNHNKKNTGVQEFRSSEVQEFRSSAEYRRIE
jgi:hypothetical protein